jgi:hypothetical protein
MKICQLIGEYFMKRFVFSVVVAFFILVASHTANAQCVSCSPSETGFSCVSEETGGKSCKTSNDSRSCTVTGLCGVKKPKTDFDFEDYFYRPINFNHNTILGIASSHPRLAETLIQLQGNTLAELYSGEISWMPGEVYYQDIKLMLDPNSDKDSLYKALQIRDTTAYQLGYKPISYTFTVEKPSSGHTVTLRIQRKDSFASLHDAYSCLELSIDITNSSALTDASSWKLR